MLNTVSLAKAFGDVVRELRVATNWSQEKLASRAGVHRTYVGDLENGRKSPTLDVVEAIASAFNTPAHKLIEAAERRRDEGRFLRVEGNDS